MMPYEHCPHSHRCIYTNRQRRIVYSLYSSNTTKDVAEAAGMTEEQARQLAARMQIRKDWIKPKTKRKDQPLTERQLQAIRRMSYIKARLNNKSYRFPDDAVMNLVLVTGQVFSKPIGRMSVDSAWHMRSSIFNLYHNAIETYITVRSKANTITNQ